MKKFIIVAVAFFSLQMAIGAGQAVDCQRGWNKINNDYKRDFDQAFQAAESAWGEANYLKEQRGDKLPGQEGALAQEAWKRSVRDQKWAIGRAIGKMEEARQVYDYYDRPRPKSGFDSFFWWKNPRKTWYAVDVEELINANECYREFVTINGVSMSIHLAAQNFDRDVQKKTSRMIARAEELREMARWLEESEIKRLNPDKYNHCMQVAQAHVDTILAREFCGEIDSVGYQKLMPFMGCMSNLSFWGYQNGPTTRRSFYASTELRSSKFFDTCRKLDNIQAMLASNSWSSCMSRVVSQYSFPSDAGRFCVAEQQRIDQATREGLGTLRDINREAPSADGACHSN